MEELIEQKEMTSDKYERTEIGHQLNMKLVEIENLEKAMQENANVLSEWMDAKKINEENRERIQAMFTNIQSSKKKDIIEMQIQMRKLKLEKADLHFQNLQIKKEVMLSKRQNETKEKRLKQLMTEIEQMKRDLAAKDRELVRSKQILDQKDEELRSIKKITGLTPQDVKQMAGDQNPIEVLQQIAINHQLTPTMYATSNGYQKENRAILNHPFYKNMSLKCQENVTQFLTGGNLKSNSKTRSSKLAENKTQKYRYAKNENQDQSLYSLSSIGNNNEICPQKETRIKQSSSQTNLEQKSDSYSAKRDNHKVKQIGMNQFIFKIFLF